MDLLFFSGLCLLCLCARLFICVLRSCKFGWSDKFGQLLCLFHILIIRIKTKLTKQTLQILMRRLIKSRPILISTVCKCMSEFT